MTPCHYCTRPVKPWTCDLCGDTALVRRVCMGCHHHARAEAGLPPLTDNDVGRPLAIYGTAWGGKHDADA